MKEKIEALAARLQADTQARFIKDGYTLAVHLPNTLSKVKYGRKYANVDIGGSGKYMIELDTGRIFGIKAYGVIHRGHQYGTLDTIEDYDWGGYTAVLRQSVAA